MNQITAAPPDLAFIVRVLEIYDDADAHDSLFWRVIDGRLILLATCNDVFWWATADAEEITPDNLPVLEQANADLKGLALPVRSYLGELFAARVRGLRPQRPWFRDKLPELVALFEACGPVRDRKDEG